jgi:hypothetical protein
MLSPSKNRPELDLVYTPVELAVEIINHFKPAGRVLDPCRGKGAFFDNIPSDTKDWCEVADGRDFFGYGEGIDWIITNPPWSKMREFIRHGCTLSSNVVYLSTLTHFCTKARLRDLVELGCGLKEFYCVPTPKENWPASGFQLGAMHIQKGYDGPLTLTGNIGA